MTNFFSRAGLTSGQDKRRAAFAGTWYEADANKLRAQLSRFLEQADEAMKTVPIEPSFKMNSKIEGSVLAIVAPHAGYIFSGPTAAFAYDAASDDRKIKRVFLLGPSHYAGFPGAALPSEKSFATPLGDLKVDRQVIDDLLHYPGFEIMPEVHRREHSLELQLPFIREAFGDVRIVPIVVGLLGDVSEMQVAAQILRRYIEPDDLVVVSSDFTHYGPRYDYEPYPGKVRDNVRKLDEEAFSYLHKADLQGFFDFRERTQDTICGFFPCSLLLAMLPEDSHATLLNYRTSQDSMGEDEANSVSYMAVAFSHPTSTAGWPKEETSNVKLTDADKSALLKIARKALETFVREKRQITQAELKPLMTPVMKKAMGVFVTLYKRNIGRNTVHGEDKELRGCVGYIFPVKPLIQAVIDNAIGSASRDYRFQGVIEEELKDLQIDINLLTPPRRVKSYKDIVIGRDGILLYKQGRQAVFLPSVATEFGWDLEQTLAQLAMKAGFPADAWKQDAQFDVFQSISVEEE